LGKEFTLCIPNDAASGGFDFCGKSRGCETMDDMFTAAAEGNY